MLDLGKVAEAAVNMSNKWYDWECEDEDYQRMEQALADLDTK